MSAALSDTPSDQLTAREIIAAAPPVVPQGRRTTAFLAVALVALFFAAFVVLSSAIDWPNSLDLPAAEGLPLVAAETTGLLTGYWLYFAYSLGIAPLAVLLPRALGARSGVLVALIVVTGAISAAFRALGIARWLLAMPALADTYVEAAPGSATREAALVTYTTLNDFGGGVGEILGVTLTGAALAALVSVLVLRTAGPRWLAAVGFLAAVSLLLALVDELFVVVGTTAFLVWLLALAVHLFRSPAAATGIAR